MADSSNREVKKNNRIRTLRAVLAGGRISQPALAAELGHSGPTVLSNIRELIQLGLVEEIGVFDSTGGRRAKAESSYLEEYGGDFSERLARRNPFEQDTSYFKFCRHRLGASALGAALLLVEDFIRGL